jgi:uncharacterized protein DUF6788
MKDHKSDLSAMSARRLLARRRALAERLGSVEEVLAGTLAEQTRRCGKAGCRCAGGEQHGPYAYFTARPQGRSRARRRYLQRGEQVETVLAEISAINAELLARRVLD